MCTLILINRKNYSTLHSIICTTQYKLEKFFYQNYEVISNNNNKKSSMLQKSYFKENTKLSLTDKTFLILLLCVS